MPASDSYKLTHDLSAVAGGDIQTTAANIRSGQTFDAIINCNFIEIAYYAKPGAGTMTPKFRVWTYHELLGKWGSGDQLVGRTVSDTTNGETVSLEPILVADRKVAILLDDCELGGVLQVEVKRAGGPLR